MLFCISEHSTSVIRWNIYDEYKTMQIHLFAWKPACYLFRFIFEWFLYWITVWMRVIFKAEKNCHSVLMHYTVLVSFKAMQRIIKKNPENKQQKKTHNTLIWEYFLFGLIFGRNFTSWLNSPLLKFLIDLVFHCGSYTYVSWILNYRTGRSRFSVMWSNFHLRWLCFPSWTTTSSSFCHLLFSVL